MSSSSDSDEFFDAQEDFSHSSSSSRTTSASAAKSTSGTSEVIVDRVRARGALHRSNSSHATSSPSMQRAQRVTRHANSERKVGASGTASGGSVGTSGGAGAGGGAAGDGNLAVPLATTSGGSGVTTSSYGNGASGSQHSASSMADDETTDFGRSLDFSQLSAGQTATTRSNKSALGSGTNARSASSNSASTSRGGRLGGGGGGRDAAATRSAETDANTAGGTSVAARDTASTHTASKSGGGSAAGRSGPTAADDDEEEELPPEFVVKNLDTGEVLSSSDVKQIHRKLASVDPISHRMQQEQKERRAGHGSRGSNSTPVSPNARGASPGWESSRSHANDDGGDSSDEESSHTTAHSDATTTEGVTPRNDARGARDAASPDGNGGKKKGWWRRMRGGKPEESELQRRVRQWERVDAFRKTELHSKQTPELGCILEIQSIPGHSGPVWSMEFSPDGRYLASGGRDNVVCVWLVNDAGDGGDGELPAGADDDEELSGVSGYSNTMSTRSGGLPTGRSSQTANTDRVLHTTPRFFVHSKAYRTYTGHTGDVLTLSWSRSSHFLLSSSMDTTVRLWNVARSECLFAFQHIDMVTAVTFHPTNEKLFLSGSLDNKLRVWSIKEKRVMHWIDVRGFITAVAFNCEGTTAIAGTYDGKCTFFETDGLRWKTQIHVRSTRGKNRKGKKITGIVVLPDDKHVLVTSNDSRIRLYRINDYSLLCKYRGAVNDNFQIKASLSYVLGNIVCGSDDGNVVLWNMRNELNVGLQGQKLFGGLRRDRNEQYESFQAHDKPCVCAVVAPTPYTSLPTFTDQIIATASYAGEIKVFQNQLEAPSNE